MGGAEHDDVRPTASTGVGRRSPQRCRPRDRRPDLAHVDDGNDDIGRVLGPRREEGAIGEALNERSSDRWVKKRGKQWRLTNRLGRVSSSSRNSPEQWSRPILLPEHRLIRGDTAERLVALLSQRD